MRTLGELVTFSNGGTPPRSRAELWAGEIPWITGADISESGAVAPRAFISPEAVRESSTQVLPAGTVLLLTRTAVGKVGLLPSATAINQDITGVTPSDAIDTRYLMWFLRSKGPSLARKARGATIKGVTRADVASLSLNLPSVADQRRIAAILDQADAICAKRRQVLAHLDSTAQSIFHEMFVKAECERTSIGAFAEVRSGSTPSRKESANYGGAIPWVKTTEVQGGVITATSEYVTDQGVAAARLKLFPAGSVVVAMYGQGKTRGRSAVLGLPATTNQACAVIAPNDKFVPEFLQTQLAVSYERLRGEAEGGNQPNLSLGRVAAFEVFLPPVVQQREFAARIEQVNVQSATVQRALADDDELFASLQSRAFRGEL